MLDVITGLEKKFLDSLAQWASSTQNLLAQKIIPLAQNFILFLRGQIMHLIFYRCRSLIVINPQNHNTNVCSHKTITPMYADTLRNKDVPIAEE